MPGCSARFCNNRSNQGFLMHVFPRDPKRRAIWAAQVKRDNWEPSNYCYLCEVHFEDSQFELHRMDGKVKLKPCAVPTIFHHTAVKPPKRPRFVGDPARTLADSEAVSRGATTPLQGDVCSARNCASHSRGEAVALFPFPDDEERCREWVERSQNASLTGVAADVLHADARLCADHFDDAQFVDASTRETLTGDALPSSFPRHFVSVPMAEEATESATRQDCEQPVKAEPVTSWDQSGPLTYRRLCAEADRVPLPSPSWAVHRGDEWLAFVHARLSGPTLESDAVVFRDTCRAQVYLRGRRVLLGMGRVESMDEVGQLLERLDRLETSEAS